MVLASENYDKLTSLVLGIFLGHCLLTIQHIWQETITKYLAYPWLDDLLNSSSSAPVILWWCWCVYWTRRHGDLPARRANNGWQKYAERVIARSPPAMRWGVALWPRWLRCPCIKGEQQSEQRKGDKDEWMFRVVTWARQRAGPGSKGWLMPLACNKIGLFYQGYILASGKNQCGKAQVAMAHSSSQRAGEWIVEIFYIYAATRLGIFFFKVCLIVVCDTWRGMRHSTLRKNAVWKVNKGSKQKNGQVFYGDGSS